MKIIYTECRILLCSSGDVGNTFKVSQCGNELKKRQSRASKATALIVDNVFVNTCWQIRHNGYEKYI